MDETKYSKRNKQVAANRGESWGKNLIRGRLEAALKPSILRLRRAELGVSQKAIAKSIGLSISSVGDLEKGKRGMSEAKAEIVAGLLKSRISRLFEKRKKKYFALKVG